MIYGEQTSPVLGALAPNLIAVLPLAATEQHGDHLPVITDTAITNEIVRRVELAMSQEILVLPTLWAGCSDHHMGFPGALSISSGTYVHVLCDLVNSLIKTGFRRIFILNGHGGNQTPFAEALYRLNLEHAGPNEPWIAAASYWNLAAPELAAQSFMESSRLSHACEYETSLMLALNKDYADMTRAKGTTPLMDSRVTVAQSFHQFTPNGAVGHPELATAGKGERLYEIISAATVNFLRDFSQWEWPRPLPH